MGFKSWVIEKLGGTVEERREAPDKEILQYELYGHEPGKGWTKLNDYPEPVEFEDFDDAEPGVMYKLQVRYKNGQVRQIWYRHLLDHRLPLQYADKHLRLGPVYPIVLI